MINGYSSNPYPHLLSPCRRPFSPQTTETSYYAPAQGLISKRDFRVHKFILSLASSVFKDMFTFHQPPDQIISEEHGLPTVDVPDCPEDLDALLRIIYPGVESPEITNLPTLTGLFLAADKYNIPTLYSVLKETLWTFSRGYPFGAYIVACRFGFSEEARAATELGNMKGITDGKLNEEVRHISSVDALHWVQFIQGREKRELIKIQESLDWYTLRSRAKCNHGDGGHDFYSGLEGAVGGAFLANPRVESNDLFAVLDEVRDPPTSSCEPAPWAPNLHRGEFGDDGDGLDCPPQPGCIRDHLINLAWELYDINRSMLDEGFGKVRSGRTLHGPMAF